MPEPKRPLKVFLCHAHADRDAVRALYTRLTNDGVDAWLDKAKLLPGQDWELEIRKAVREADVVVVCLSKQFNQAGFRQKEVRLALDTAMEKPEGEIFIIPARLEECENLESLRKWHEVDLFENDGYEMLVRALRERANKIGIAVELSNNYTGKSKIRIFYNLIYHREYDLEEVDANVAAKYLFELLIRNPVVVTTPDEHDEDLFIEYRTRNVDYFDPKDGRTIQHALIINGTISVFSDKGQYRSVKSVDNIPEMMIVTITQGVKKSKIRFDSDDLRLDILNSFMNKFLHDLIGYVPDRPL
ncbi:MAG: toll/interleukin-1 receptor domain-containing protein [Anaerolineae bacterium]|nr:toll/interleukin-1 receptor domain-containing protein [Anaerolineae bacterium]